MSGNNNREGGDNSDFPELDLPTGPADATDTDEMAIIIAEPIIIDSGDYHNSVRLGAQAAKAGELEARIYEIKVSNTQIATLLEIFRDSPQKNAVEDALRQKEIIMGVAELNKLFRGILGHFRMIFSHLTPLAIDSETNAPVFSSDNTGVIRTFLASAQHELPPPNPRMASQRARSFNITPNQELLVIFEKIMEDWDILKNPQNLAKVFQVVSDYLSVVITNTGLALEWTIQSTSDQVSSLRGTANSLHQQAEDTELYDLTVDPETLALWQSFLYEIELVFAESLVTVFDILGQNVNWLLMEIDIQEIRKILWDSLRELKALKESKQAKLEESTGQLLEQPKKLFGNLFSKSKPESFSFTILNRQINTLTEAVARLEKAIESKKNPPRKP